MNSALLILAQDSRVPEIRAKRRSSDMSQVSGLADILWVRMDTSGLTFYVGKA